MWRTRPAAALSILVMLMGLFAASPAAGAESDSAAKDNLCENEPACQNQVDKAATLATQTRYEEALTLYQRAYERWHEPRLLLNIGRCLFRIGQPARALASFESFQKALPAAEPELSERLKLFTAEAQAALAEDSAIPTPLVKQDEPAHTTAAPGSLASDAVQLDADDRCQQVPACRTQTEQAAQLATQTRYDEALALYRQAYERYAAPRLLLNIGRCYFRIGRPRKAIEAFNAYLKATQNLDAETQTRVNQFVADAHFSIMTDDNILREQSEPAPAPLDPRGDTLLYRIRHDTLSRPLWRIGVSTGAMGLGVVLMGIGAGTLAADGHCVTASAADMNVCVAMNRPDGQRSILLVDGVTPGAALLVTGGILTIGGIVLVALPPRRAKP